MVAVAIKNLKKSLHKIWHGDVSWPSRLPQQIKFCAFKNSTQWQNFYLDNQKIMISQNNFINFSRILV